MLVPLSPPPGLNSDDTTFAAEGRWADGNNYRFRLGKPESLGSSVNQFTLGAGSPALDLFAFTRSGTDTIVYATTSAAYVGTALTSATSRHTYAAGNGISFASWGNTLLIAERGAKLYDQSGTSAAAEVTEAPDRIDAGILVSDQRQVIALATNEVGGTHNPMCIRVSDLEDYSSAGSWTPTSANNADEIILAGPGAIICGRLVGPYVAVWTTTALHLGTFIGDPSQTYRFDKVADVSRPISARSTASLDGVIYWMGSDSRLRAWVPGSQPQVIPCPILRDMIDNSSVEAGSLYGHLVAKPEFGEVWFFYKDTRDSTTYASRYIAYCVGESALAQRPVWFRGKLNRSAMIDSEIVRALSASGYGLSSLSTDDGGIVYLDDRENTGIGTAAYIQSADQYLDNSQRRMMIRGIIPDPEWQSTAETISLTLYVRDRPLSTATTKGPYSILTTDTKKDFRASGKIVSAKFSSIGRLRLGKPVFDVVLLGER